MKPKHRVPQRVFGFTLIELLVGIVISNFSILPLARADSLIARAQEADSPSQDEMKDINGRMYLLVPATPRVAPVPIKPTDTCLLKWDFAAPDFQLQDNGHMAGNGYKASPGLAGQMLPYPKE